MGRRPPPRRGPFPTPPACGGGAPPSLLLAEDEAPVPAGTYRKIRVIDFEGEIEAAIAAYVGRRLDAAKADGVDCIVFRIESPGGTVFHSQKISDAILDLPKSIRTVAWVPKYAYSGAAMVSLACDEIVMARKAVLGDCQPILLGPEGIIPVGEKVESPLRAQFRKFAEDNGWPPLLSEKMVSVDFEVLELKDAEGRRHYARGDEFRDARGLDLVDGVRKQDLTQVRVAVAKDKLLTMTTAEAVDFGFVERTIDREADLVARLKAPGGEVAYVEMSASEAIGRWLLGWTGVLSALVLLCAGLAIFQGIGTMTFVGIGALAMLLLVNATADLSNGFGLLLLGLGAILLALEVFVLPGFGIAGILGIVSMFAGLLFVSTGVSFSGTGLLTWDALADFALEFVATVGVAALAMLVLTRIFPGTPIFRRILLLQGGGLEAGAIVVPASAPSAMVGQTGTALTTLRPAGRASVDGRNVDVVTEGGYVEVGTPLRVVRVEGPSVIVRPDAGGGPRA